MPTCDAYHRCHCIRNSKVPGYLPGDSRLAKKTEEIDMLQQYPSPQLSYQPAPFPSFVGLDFELKSIANPTNIHHLKIATQFNTNYSIFPHWITGTWAGQNASDVHQMTGQIGNDLTLTC